MITNFGKYIMENSMNKNAIQWTVKFVSNKFIKDELYGDFDEIPQFKELCLIELFCAGLKEWLSKHDSKEMIDYFKNNYKDIPTVKSVADIANVVEFKVENACYNKFIGGKTVDKLLHEIGAFLEELVECFLMLFEKYGFKNGVGAIIKFKEKYI